MTWPGRQDTTTEYQLEEDRWYRLTSHVDADGAASAWIDDSDPLRGTWTGTSPVTLGLACQRSGGRYCNIVVREF